MDIRQFLKNIKVLQEVSNKGRTRKLGRGFFTAIRLNPFNPISYIFIAATLIATLVWLGVNGLISETDWRNPFKWQ